MQWILAAAVAVAIVVVALAAGFFAGGSSGGARGGTPVDAACHRLLKAASRSGTMAEQQKNLLLALMEISNAKSYARALRTMMTDGDIAHKFQIDIRRVTLDLDAVEEDIMRRIASEAPGIVPEGRFAVRTGWVP